MTTATRRTALTRRTRWLAAGLLALGSGPGAQAQPTVFRCTDAAGRTAYQSEPCADTGRQVLLKLPAVPPPQPAASRPSAWTGYTPLREAVLTFYYDPVDEPVGYSTAAMEAAIQAAARAWATGCKVRISYAGRAPARLPGTVERVPIRWAPRYMRTAHPSDPRSRVAGTGSLWDGIALSPRFHEANMLSVLVHEMGHVLGLPHNHDDAQSIMSYLRDEATRKGAQPSESDYLACNLAMKQRFGIDFTPPPQAAADLERPRMSDREALEKIHGPRTR